MLACAVAFGSAFAVESITLVAPTTIVSVDRSDQNPIIITEQIYDHFKAYDKWEFNCTDSTVRYLGSSNTAKAFRPDQEDNYFASASANPATKNLHKDVCKPAAVSMTSNQ